MNNLKSIQPISLAKALGLPEPEKVTKAKPKVKKAVTKPRKIYHTGIFLGIPFTRNPEGEIMSDVLDHPLENPKGNMQQCYCCDHISEQPHYKGKVQRIVYDPKSKTGISVPPNCPKCNHTKLGPVKEQLSPVEQGEREHLEGVDILNKMKAFLVKNIQPLKSGYTNSDMDEDEIDEVVIQDESDGTMEAFDNALPLSNFVKVGYKVKEDDSIGLEETHGSMVPQDSFYETSCSGNRSDLLWLRNGHQKHSLKTQNYGINHNSANKKMMCRREDYHTTKGTLYQDNTCFKHFHVYPHRSLSYFQIEKLMKEGFSAKKQYRKICNRSPNGYESIEAEIQIEKRDIAAMRLKTGDMNAGPPQGSWSKIPKKDYKKDYEKETMDREFKSLVLEKELGVNVELLDTHKIAMKVEQMKE